MWLLNRNACVLAAWHFLVIFLIINTLFELTLLLSIRQHSLGWNHLHNDPLVRMPSKTGCSMRWTLYLTFTPHQIPEKDDSAHRWRHSRSRDTLETESSGLWGAGIHPSGIHLLGAVPLKSKAICCSSDMASCTYSSLSLAGNRHLRKRKKK